MKRAHLVVVKPMRYGTRRLRAGDTFDAINSEAVIFRALGWANDAPSVPVKPVAVDELRAAVMQADDDVDVLRSEYETRAGKAADKRWGVVRLKAEIEALP